MKLERSTNKMAVPGRQPISEGFTWTVNPPVTVEAVGGEKWGKLLSVPLIFEHLWWIFWELLLVNTDMTNPAETGECQIENAYKSRTKMTCFIQHQFIIRVQY